MAQLPSLAALSLHQPAPVDVVFRLSKYDADGPAATPEDEERVRDSEHHAVVTNSETTRRATDTLQSIVDALGDISDVGVGHRNSLRQSARTNMANKEVYYLQKALEYSKDARREEARLLDVYKASIRAKFHDATQRYWAVERQDHFPSLWQMLSDEAKQPWQLIVSKQSAARERAHLARERHDEWVEAPAFEANIAELREDLRSLIDDYPNDESMQEHLAELLWAFMRSAQVASNSMNNLVLMGPAGVGKTRLARTLGRVFANMGLYIIPDVVEITSSSWIGQYIGETAVKTRNWLETHMDQPVLLDEAYAIAPWDHETNRLKASSYAAEALEQLVDFLDKNMGRTCIMAAGYAREMQTQFLRANQGMDRRFPMKATLGLYSNDKMFDIFIDGVATTVTSGWPTEKQRREAVLLQKRHCVLWFSPSAIALFKVLIQAGRTETPDGETNEHKVKALLDLFKAEAGAMRNLGAMVGAMLLALPEYERLGSPAQAKADPAKRPRYRLDHKDVYALIVRALVKQNPDMGLKPKYGLEDDEDGSPLPALKEINNAELALLTFLKGDGARLTKDEKEVYEAKQLPFPKGAKTPWMAMVGEGRSARLTWTVPTELDGEKESDDLPPRVPTPPPLNREAAQLALDDNLRELEMAREIEHARDHPTYYGVGFSEDDAEQAVRAKFADLRRRQIDADAELPPGEPRRFLEPPPWPKEVVQPGQKQQAPAAATSVTPARPKGGGKAAGKQPAKKRKTEDAAVDTEYNEDADFDEKKYDTIVEKNAAKMKHLQARLATLNKKQQENAEAKKQEMEALFERQAQGEAIDLDAEMARVEKKYGAKQGFNDGAIEKALIEVRRIKEERGQAPFTLGL